MAETIKDIIEFCIIPFQQDGNLKLRYDNFKGFNTDILFKASFELSPTYRNNEVKFDLNAFKRALAEFSVELDWEFNENELNLVVFKINEKLSFSMKSTH